MEGISYGIAYLSLVFMLVCLLGLYLKEMIQIKEEYVKGVISWRNTFFFEFRLLKHKKEKTKIM